MQKKASKYFKILLSSIPKFRTRPIPFYDFALFVAFSLFTTGSPTQAEYFLPVLGEPYKIQFPENFNALLKVLETSMFDVKMFHLSFFHENTAAQASGNKLNKFLLRDR